MKNISETWKDRKTISIVTDTPGWFDTHAEDLAQALSDRGHSTRFIRSYRDIPHGDIAFYLSCMRITPPDILLRNRWNLVVHASDLPKGRGFSPVVWQVLEGASVIPVTMIVMAEQVDAGDIVSKDSIDLKGYELNDEIRMLLGRKIVHMCLQVADAASPPSPIPQQGEASWYPRRTSDDSRLNPQGTIASQFDLLRTVDNQRYPAFFDYRGHRYTLKIERDASLSGQKT